MCVLLQSLHMHLSSPELEEITSLLEQSATESQENQNIVPFVPEKKLNQPVPLTDIPKVRCVYVCIVCMYVRRCVCMSVCVYVCLSVCMCVFQLYHLLFIYCQLLDLLNHLTYLTISIHTVTLATRRGKAL